MARRRRGRVVDGILLLHKDAGLSSNAALQTVKRLLQAQKAGHGGTLDPFAEGVLPILFGQASKFGQYLLGDDKRYRATAQFGAETDTDDKDGQIISQTNIPDLAKVDWPTVLAKFVGVQAQVPPTFSALKINGQRAYALARAGKAPKMQAREITVYAFELVSVGQSTATFDIHCAKGTYIRALIRDLARALNSSAHTSQLTRTAVGTLQAPCYRLSALKEKSLHELDALLLPVERCVHNLPKLQIPAQKLPYLIHGNDVRIDEVALSSSSTNAQTPPANTQALKVALYDQKRFLGVGEWDATVQRVYPKRLLGQLTS